ncbi:UNKNOWN [Stylonychia lemnae]|uniref:Mapeg family protein n=1 Tax=Stylonychia lemnae TaxID=5949 RepID=A0A078A7M6_STYLE|nr:UNKNOWN [Stylonychia lemnae]|eukprot:CDW77567.1 UNKNOWN [Stylonychia lemnae]
MLNTQPDNYPELFPYVLIVMVLICGSCLSHGPLVTIQARKRNFGPEFMSQFFETHKQFFKSDVNPVGFPDTGSGRYCEQMSYKNWIDFNNAFRCHLNFVEQLPIMMVIIYLAALKQPLAALILSSMYFICKILYTIGYVLKGPNLRQIGALPIFFIKWTLYGLSFYTVACYLDQYRAENHSHI